MNLFNDRNRRHVAIAVTSDGRRVQVPVDGTGLVDGSLDAEELQLLLNEMPEEFRTTVVLFYFQGHSYKEIAEQMETPIGTVMSRLSRGKAYLRSRLLQRLGNDAPATATTDY